MKETETQRLTKSLPIAVDAMGSDLGARSVVVGAVRAVKENKIPVILVGLEEKLRDILKSLGADTDEKIRIVGAEEVIGMDESPSAAIRGKTNSSVRKAFELVKQGEASAVIGAGNTGAMMAAGVYVSGTLPGIARPAIASLIPRAGNGKLTVLLDSGANIDCHAEQLVQFALMGKYYAEALKISDFPEVALLSNGAEPTKGNEFIRSAALKLANIEDVNFVGFVEGRDITAGTVDVVVCDGLIGNVVLKTIEGSIELVFESIKHVVDQSLRGRIGMWLAKPAFRSLFRKKLNPSTYGGAPLLGLNDIAIVCHGSSNSKAITNAICVAHQFVQSGLVDHMKQALAVLDTTIPTTPFDEDVWNKLGQKLDKKTKSKI